VTAKWTEAVPDAPTAIGPDQVRRPPKIVGSALVAPLVEPATYVNPAGRSSKTDDSETVNPFGFANVIV
jgi:hypothetical protein